MAIIKPWHRLKNEDAIAYDLFVAWLSFDPQKRVVEEFAVERQLTADFVRGLLRRFNWKARTLEYDAYFVNLTQRELERIRKSDAVRWAERERAYREQEFGLAQELINKARDLNRLPITTQEVTRYERVIKDGIEIDLPVQIIVKPGRAGTIQRAAASIIETASKLARLSIGMATNRQEVNVTGGVDQNALEKAKAYYLQLTDEFADRPEVLEKLPQWFSQQWEVKPEFFIEATVEEPKLLM